jgi:hypothetical protein
MMPMSGKFDDIHLHYADPLEKFTAKAPRSPRDAEIKVRGYLLRVIGR